MDNINTNKPTITIWLKKVIRNLINACIVGLSRLSRADLLYLAHRERGILRSGNFRTTGEMFFVENYLRSAIKNEKIVFIDAGANKGNYSVFLKKIFPSAQIHSFEPNPYAYKTLLSKAKEYGLFVHNAGLSSSASTVNMYLYADDATTERASLYGGSLKDMFDFNHPRSVNVQLTRLDDFCHKQNIDRINFLKIDTEGHEFEVLKGAGSLLEQAKIDIIQFEFNMTNIVSRVFLKDFYELMPNYDFYRLRRKNLLPLGPYNSVNEIFIIHNLIAIPRMHS